MTQRPHINKMKFGIIDAPYMNSISESAAGFEDMKPRLMNMMTSVERMGSQLFLVYITSEEAIASYDDKPIAWKYNWTRVEFSSLGNSMQGNEGQIGYLLSEENYLSCPKVKDPKDPPCDIGKDGVNNLTSEALRTLFESGDTGNLSGYAYNLAELSNILTSPIVFGVNMDSENYPEGYAPQSCPISSVVRLTEIGDVAGRTNYLFDRQGVHDGDCETV
jgi:hypothetical protein